MSLGIFLGNWWYTIEIIVFVTPRLGVTILHFYAGPPCFQCLRLRVLWQDIGDVVRDEEKAVGDRWPVAADRVEHLLPGHRESIGREGVSVRVEDAIHPI